MAASGAISKTRQRFLSRWVLIALGLDLVLALVDVATSRSVVLTTAYLVPPLAVALVENGERTALVGGFSILLAFLSGSWNDYLFSAQHVYRLGIVAGSGVLAVAGATLRTRAVTARDRMALLGEVAQIADGQGPMEQSLRRLADLLVPAVADLCEIVLVEEGTLRRCAVRTAGASRELEQQLLERPAGDQASILTRSAGRLADAQLVTRVDAAHLAALASDARDRQLLAGLQMRSSMYAPMRAAGHTLAVLTLAVGPSARHYGSDDLAFARTVASRAALAIENARLLHELGEAEQRMEAIVGSLAEAVTIRDRSGMIVYANDAALQSMGFVSIDEIRARPPRSIMDEYIVRDAQGNDVTMEAIPSVRLLAGEEPEPLLMRCVHRELGNERWLLLKAAPLYDADGKIEAAVTIIEDVTAASRAQLQTSFLSRSSEILASSLDYEETLRNVAWLVVPEIADWCAVDLVDERGARQQVVVAHPEPQKLELAARLRGYEPEQLDQDQGLGAVLRDGRSELYPEVTPAMLEAGARDKEHLRMLLDVGMRSVLIVPLQAGGRVIGAMTLVTAESGRRFDAEDVQFAEAIAARAAVAVENSRLYTRRSQIAATLQQSLLPDALPEIPGWELASLYRPASAGGEVVVGGDFYDAFATKNGWMMLIGDVTGKGVEVAAMTSLVRHGARFIGESFSQPDEILSRLNASLRREPGLTLCSVLCMRIEADQVCFASAGHPLPLLVTDNGVRPVGAPGPVLGAFDDSEWPVHKLVPAPNELLLLYTDGVTDTVGADERFGERRLRETVAEAGPVPAAELLRRLDRVLSDFQVGTWADDTAALALRLMPLPAIAEPAPSSRAAHGARGTVGCRGSDRAGRDQRADQHQDERGEHVPPALEPLPLDLVSAERAQQGEADNRSDRDSGEHHQRADRSGDAGCRRGKKHREDRQIG